MKKLLLERKCPDCGSVSVVDHWGNDNISICGNGSCKWSGDKKQFDNYSVEEVETDGEKFTLACQVDVETMIEGGSKFEVRRSVEQKNDYDTRYIVCIDPTKAKPVVNVYDPASLKPLPRVHDLVMVGRFWHDKYASILADRLNEIIVKKETL